ncbi:MAG: DUF975 family protein [Fusicatenibacter sp.]|nr:DUF975 family protein [Lachnospiraceae bacterium]MDY2937802.1 DUF975 family protein [Fusicatenibacter sp.]
MMWTRAELKYRGKTAFLRNYWMCVAVALILSLVVGTGGSSASSRITYKVNEESSSESFLDVEEHFYDFADHFSPIRNPIRTIFAAVGFLVVLIFSLVFLLLRIFVFKPLEIGGCRFFMENAYEKTGIGKLLYPFQSGYYSKMVLAMFLRDLYIGLWSLLLVIPEIVKAYEYRMVPYLLADCPEMERSEAFRLSKEMMYGQKMNTFILDISFIGWRILSACTCNLVGIFFTEPYVNSTNAELFLRLKQDFFGRQSTYSQGTYRSY